jgi:hypothetical protein
MMRKTWLAVASLGLLACSEGQSSAQSPAPPPSASSPWSDLNGTPMQLDGGGKTFFVFPTAPPGVNYVTKSVDGLLPRISVISLSYRVTAIGTPRFDYRTNPNNICGPGFPGTVRLFIQRAGDSLSGAGPFQQYRYWSTLGVRELAPGSFTVQAALDPAQWTDVFGKPGSDYPERFHEALENAARVGITFGGGCFYGHGVFNSGRSTAKFTIDEFLMQ